MPIANDDSGLGFATSFSSLFTTANVLLNDTDPEGQEFGVSSIDTTATQGLVTNNNNGTFTYDPNGAFDFLLPGETAADSFAYTIFDSFGDSDTGIVTITVNGPPTDDTFTPLDPVNDSDDLAIVSSVLGADPDISISNLVINGGQSEPGGLALYDGSIAELGIDNGLFLSSGSSTPALENTSEDFTVQIGRDGDADLDAVASAAFSGAGATEDATTISFDFTVADGVEGIRFDLLVGSEEFPEFSDTAYVDVAGVFLNGQNIALFNESPDQPLSVISENLDIGNFRDNQFGMLDLEFDGISAPLSIQGAVQDGVNTLKIAIADTGDQNLDSGLFIANLETTGQGGSGLFVSLDGDDQDNTLDGTESDELFDAGAGNDSITNGGGDDVIDAGEGDDQITLDAPCEGSTNVDGGAGMDTVIYGVNLADAQFTQTGDGMATVCNDTLTNVETVVFADQTVSLVPQQQNPAGEFAVSGGSIAEGDTGTSVLPFTVTLSGAGTGVRTVDYAVSAGTATEGDDYTAASGTLTFAEGETSMVVEVEVLGDTDVEPDETLTLTLSNPGGDEEGTITTASATGTIENDDATPPPPPPPPPP
ncbi:MAG: choice-of-anchor L domain-containing protein, partial [Pelagimonas sp.]|nr:choice-of-anchor L domain-containing protein [Pelagimonas sp.]